MLGNVEGSLCKGVERRRSRPLERANESERVKRLTVRELRNSRPASLREGEGQQVAPNFHLSVFSFQFSIFIFLKNLTENGTAQIAASASQRAWVS